LPAINGQADNVKIDNRTTTAEPDAHSQFLGLPIEVIAAIIGASVTAVAFFWSTIQSLQKRRLFQNLIYRELKELKPYTEGEQLTQWHCYVKRDFVHQKIFENVSENRDFILSLNPDLIYYISQLWYSVTPKKENAIQWLYYLYEIARHSKNKDIKKTWEEWAQVVIKMQHNEYALYSKNLTNIFVHWAYLFHNHKITDEEKENLIRDKYNAKLRNCTYDKFIKFKKKMIIDD
jgi:hypothetical protein